MMRVSLVGTVHAQQGLASISELRAILKRIQPEVIFLEIPSAVFDDYLDGTRSNLESSAARLYRESDDVALVPVDLPTPEAEFFRDSQYLFERIEKSSPEYCRLIDRNSQYVTTHGFAYLNSELCSKHWSDTHEAIHTAIERLDDHRLIELYELWKNTNELRDRAMLKNIEDYYLLRPFENGVFLVGAAHRQSLISKSREGRGAGTPRIEWDVSGFLYRSIEKEVHQAVPGLTLGRHNHGL